MAPISTSFDPELDLILIRVQLTGPRRDHHFWFALDTGCSETLVSHETLAEIGYQARDGEATATVTSALGQERGYLLRVARLEALGHAIDNLRVNAQDLPPEAGINGLLGLNFLRHFNYEVRSREGHILVAPA